jgi:hypothetical protein
MIPKKYIKPILIVLMILLLGGCIPKTSNAGASCAGRDLVICEDFENLSGDLGASQLLHTSLYGNWWVTGDEDTEFLFEDFPVDGRSRKNMIQQGDGSYADGENSLLYTAEINLANVESATLSYSLIYQTEEHWDGLVVFAIIGGENGIGDGKNWIVLDPENGYPGTVLINGNIFPGYSGKTTTWLHEKIDLDPVLGESIILGFYFASDGFEEDWGAALDDIAITASSDLNLAPTWQTIDLTELELELPDQSFLSPFTPRINVTLDSYCENSPEILVNGQRAYVKGINDSGDRALVLHPTTDILCWVSLDNAWIDGDMGGLPRISDLQPEDYYLPICAASFTPIITGENCSTLPEGLNYQDGFFPYRLQSALVDEGRITQVVLTPTFDGISEVDFDPRISLQDYQVGSETFSPPGGVFWLKSGDDQSPCYFTRDRTGKVICDNFSFNAAGPLKFDLCWQGYDGTQDCPAGYGSYQDSCLHVGDLTSCQVNCPSGYQFYDLLGICLLDRAPEFLENNPDLCPDGMSVFSNLGCCAETRYGSPRLCPEGYYYLADQAGCLLIPEALECPDGFSLNTQTGECYSITQTAKVRCTSLQVEFPVYDVTVRESTKCYKDPENKNEIISSLSPFSVARILGLGEDGKTLVVENPEYKVPCWASLEDFYIDELDLGILPVVKSGD